MKTRIRAVATRRLPVLGYPIPSSEVLPDPAPKKRRTAGRTGKRHFHGVKVVMNADYVHELRAAAQLVGMRFDSFLYDALFGAIGETAKMFGMTSIEMGDLSKQARADLARRFRAFNSLDLDDCGAIPLGPATILKERRTA